MDFSLVLLTEAPQKETPAPTATPKNVSEGTEETHPGSVSEGAEPWATPAPKTADGTGLFLLILLAFAVMAFLAVVCIFLMFILLALFLSCEVDGWFA